MSEKQDLSGLIPALASENARFEAADRLISMGSKAVEPLLTALTFENWKVRGNAAWALGKIGDARAVGALVEALGDDVPEVRATAGRALLNIGAPSIEPLREAAERGNGRKKGLACCVLSCLEIASPQGPACPL